jgi:hypothetical protein
MPESAHVITREGYGEELRWLLVREKKEERMLAFKLESECIGTFRPYRHRHKRSTHQCHNIIQHVL